MDIASRGSNYRKSLKYFWFAVKIAYINQKGVCLQSIDIFYFHLFIAYT